LNKKSARCAHIASHDLHMFKGISLYRLDVKLRHTGKPHNSVYGMCLLLENGRTLCSRISETHVSSKLCRKLEFLQVIYWLPTKVKVKWLIVLSVLLFGQISRQFFMECPDLDLKNSGMSVTDRKYIERVLKLQQDMILSTLYLSFNEQNILNISIYNSNQ